MDNQNIEPHHGKHQEISGFANQQIVKANDNGEAVYDFSYQTAVMVTE